eukprot:jgi/Botrbrau1/5665/Bobra.0071s0010.2
MSTFVPGIWHKKSKSAPELAQKAYAAIDKLVDPQNDKQQDECAKYLNAMKAAIYGEGEEPDERRKQEIREQALMLCLESCKLGFPMLIVNKLPLLDFESRKDASQVCSSFFRMEPGVQYIEQHPSILSVLFQGYSNSAIALNCGAMLRDCVRSEPIARIMLQSSIFKGYFQKVEVSNFEVASDAFATFKDLLTRHKTLVAEYLGETYADFFESYNKLLQSDNYVTKRQSLKLLGELLLDRANVRVMMKYVSDVNNLKLMMTLLKDSSKSIQFEAFHVFKVFVANPNKTEPIVELLSFNKEKLLKYLSDFHTDKGSMPVLLLVKN